MNSNATVYVVDDDAATRDAMHTLFEAAGLYARAYATAEEFLGIANPDSSGCLVVDLRMPGMSGLELQRRVRESWPHMPVIFVTGHGNISAAVRAMRAGADDFLTKPLDDEALIERVHEALIRRQRNRNGQPECDEVAARMEHLTTREREVMDRVVSGQSSKIIARDLGISPKTVELHRAHMMDKMAAGSIADLVRFNLLVQYEQASL